MGIHDFINEWANVIIIFGGLIWFIIWCITKACDDSFIHELYEKVELIHGRVDINRDILKSIDRPVASIESLNDELKPSINRNTEAINDYRYRLQEIYNELATITNKLEENKNELKSLDVKYDDMLKKIIKKVKKNESN